MWYGHYMWSSWPMMLGGIVFWGAILVLIVWAVYRITRHPDVPSHYGKTALDHLKERYAKGEITKEQYDEIRRDLER
jgi:putative membrane protein